MGLQHTIPHSRIEASRRFLTGWWYPSSIDESVAHDAGQHQITERVEVEPPERGQAGSSLGRRHRWTGVDDRVAYLVGPALQLDLDVARRPKRRDDHQKELGTIGCR